MSSVPEPSSSSSRPQRDAAPHPPSPPTRWLARLLGCDDRDVLPIALAVAMGFLLFAAYSLLKPLRDATNAAVADRFGERATVCLTTATLGGMVLASLLVGFCLSRLGWRRLFLAAQGLWVFIFLAFGIAFLRMPEALKARAASAVGKAAASAASAGTAAPSPDVPFSISSIDAAAWLAFAFIVWVSVFNLLSLSLMWTRLADLFAPASAKRIYPIVGIGVTLGGVVAPLAVTRFAKAIDPHHWVFVACVLLVASAGAAFALLRLPGRRESTPASAAAPSTPHGTFARGPLAPLADAGRVLSLVGTSPYLLGLCIYMLLYSTTGTIIWFEQQRIVRAAEVTTDARLQAFATIDTATNTVTLLLQSFFAGRIIALVGVALALLVTPITTAVGVTVLWLSPTLGALIGVQVGRRALHYAIDRPAREALATVLEPDQRRRAKSFIDTFVYRSGDQIGAWVQGALGQLSGAVVAGGVVACVIWGTVGLAVGRTMERRARAAATPPQPLSATPTG